jgi:serine/threonine protein kinase
MLADRYELGALIGRGGAANVYRGWDLSLERSVAIKVVPADVDPTGLDRRQSEAKLLASLNQASLVTLYDAIVAADAT